MPLDEEFLHKFDNEFTDRQRQIALIGTESELHLQTNDEYLEFLEDPRSFLFTKCGEWVGPRIVDAIAEAYKEKKIKENPYTEEFLQDIAYVNNVIAKDGHKYDGVIEERFLLRYEASHTKEMLPDVDLNGRFINRLISESHSTWEFPRTKCFVENTIKRMYVTAELYLEKIEVLKDYYNSLKKYNDELKDDSIKLVNAVNKDIGNSRKVTLYNCRNPISKEIWKYPLRDIVDNRWNISWGRAFNDPKLEEFFIKEFESKEIDETISYCDLFLIFTYGNFMGSHRDIGLKLIEMDGFKEKYFNSYVRDIYSRKNIFRVSNLDLDLCNSYFNSNFGMYLRSLIEYFPYMQKYSEVLYKACAYCLHKHILQTSKDYNLAKEDEFKKFVKEFKKIYKKNG